MDQLDFKKENAFKTMFFTLKILALFFCAIPLFQRFISGLSDAYLWSNISVNLISCLILLMLLAFIWMFMDKHHDKKAVFVLEICVFFILCSLSVYSSGFIESDYKFVFIFMIVIYTVESGIKVGSTIAGCASVALLGSDLLFFGKSGVNPFFEMDLTLCAMFIVVAWALGYYVRIANSHINELSGFANMDGLTGVYNHRYFFQSLKQLCDDCNSSGDPLSLIMMDMDYFKIYNDMYGHQQGDVALKELANLLIEFLPSDAVISRYGGDEFTIILSNTEIDKARETANNLRNFVCDHNFVGEEHLPGESFTVSMGVAQYRNNKDTCASFVKRADSALYRAKYLRRNSVQVYTSVFEEFNNLDEDSQQMKETLKSLKALITVINSRDSYTFSHTDRVVMLCMEVADYMELSKEDKKRLCYAAYLHDLGKINVAKEILISEEKLTAAEWEELKRHPVESAAIISEVEGLEDIVPIVLQHHERYDGKGYPNNVKGEGIEYLARILSLVDSFDAMTNSRPYQPTKSYAQAFKEIEACSGTQFDPVLSQIFIDAVKTRCDTNLLAIR